MKKRFICSNCGFYNDLDSSYSKSETGHEPVCTNCGSLLEIEVEEKKSFYLLKFILIFSFISLFVFLLNQKYNSFNLKDDFFQITYQVIAVFIVASALASGRFLTKFKYLAAWAAIFAAAILLNSYRFEILKIKDRVLADIIPGRGVARTLDSMSFSQASDGHYYMNAVVNGKPVLFLADTGASSVVLSPHDARRVGYDMDKLRFDRTFSTANGMVKGSSVSLSTFELGGLKIESLEASVNKAEMRHSLLGMTFFQKLDRFEIKNETLTLYWH